MNKGIVMEMTRRSIVLMTPQGSFEQIPRNGHSCEIGEEIAYNPAKRSWKLPAVMTTAAAAVIFCLFLAVGLPGQRQQAADPVVAYISIDINPSVELGIDSRENVLELNGLNQDGADIIRSIPYKGKTLSEVASLLLDKAEQGVLGKGEGDIVIASTAVGSSAAVNDALLAAKLRDQVARHIEKMHPDKVSTYVVTAFAAPAELRVKARDDGLSTGKYALWLDAKSQGSPLPLQKFRDTSIHQIVKEDSGFGQLIHNGKLPSKADFKVLLEEEVSGKLDEKAKNQQNGKTPASGISNGSGERDNGNTGSNAADKHNTGSSPGSNINGANDVRQNAPNYNNSNKDHSDDNNTGNAPKQNNNRSGSDYRNYIPPAVVPAPIAPAKPAVSEPPAKDKGRQDEQNNNNNNNNNDSKRGQYDQNKEDIKKQEERIKRAEGKNQNDRQNEDSRRKQQDNSPPNQPGSSRDGEHSDHRNGGTGG